MGVAIRETWKASCFELAKALRPAESTPCLVTAHEHLYFEGTERRRVFVIEKGWVKLYRTTIEGQRQAVAFANGGTVLGLECGKDYSSGCEALTDVTARTIPVERLSELCLERNGFAMLILGQMSRQLEAAHAQIVAIGAQGAEQKLAAFLLWIADLSGDRDSEFDLPMRRGDIAEYLGLRIETISRKFTDFQKRGWIELRSVSRCRILRVSAVEESALGAGASEAHDALAAQIG